MPDSQTLAFPRRSALISALIHAAAIVLVLLSTSRYSPIATLLPQRDTTIYVPRMPHTSHGRGGGQRSPLPVPKGQPPKPSPRVFTMPVMVTRNTPPPLEMPPEVLGLASNTPVVDLVHIGSLTGQAGPMSGGLGNWRRYRQKQRTRRGRQAPAPASAMIPAFPDSADSRARIPPNPRWSPRPNPSTAKRRARRRSRARWCSVS